MMVLWPGLHLGKDIHNFVTAPYFMDCLFSYRVVLFLLNACSLTIIVDYYYIVAIAYCWCSHTDTKARHLYLEA